MWPDGIPEPWEIIQSIGSYAELSPSGTGVKIFARGKLPKGGRKKVGDFETYDSGRYFTVTGHRLDGSPADVQNGNGLGGVYRAFFPAAAPKPAIAKRTAPSDGMAPDDAVIIQKASGAKNGPKVLRLWAGNTDDYQSDSEADLALAGIIVFWSQDASQLEQIMRSSGLARQKWDKHPDYLKNTITRVVEQAVETYDWGREKPDVEPSSDIEEAVLKVDVDVDDAEAL